MNRREQQHEEGWGKWGREAELEKIRKLEFELTVCRS